MAAFFCRLRQDLRTSNKVRCDANVVRVGMGETTPPQAMRRQRSSKTLPNGRLSNSGNSSQPMVSGRRSPERRQQQGPSFSAIWGGSTGSGSQEDVFMAVEPHLRRAIDREGSCTVFVYGGPSSGKTYTMVGDIGHPKEQGLVPRAINFALNYQPQGVDADEHTSDAIPAGEAPAAHTCLFELLGDQVCDLSPEGEAAVGSNCVSSNGISRQPLFAKKCRLRTVSAAAGHVAVDGMASWTCQASVVQLLSFYLRGMEFKRQASAATCFQITLLSPNGTARATLRFVELGAPRAQQQSSPSPPPVASSSRRSPGGRRPSNREASASRGGAAPANETMLAALERVVSAKIAGESFESSCRGCALSELLRPCLEGHQDLVLLLCARPDDSHVGTLTACLRLPRLLQELFGESQASANSDSIRGPTHERGHKIALMEPPLAQQATSAKAPTKGRQANEEATKPVVSAASKSGGCLPAVPADDNEVPWKTVFNQAGSIFGVAKALGSGKKLQPTVASKHSTTHLEDEKDDRHFLLPCIKEKHNSIYQLVLECERIKAAITSLEKDLITTQLERRGASNDAKVLQEQSLQAIIRKLQQDLAKQQVALEEKGKEYGELMSMCTGLVPADATLSKQLEDVQRVIADALMYSITSAPTRTPSELGAHFRQLLTEPQQSSPTSSPTIGPSESGARQTIVDATFSPGMTSQGLTRPPSESVTPMRSPEIEGRRIPTNPVPMIWPPATAKSSQAQMRAVPRLRIVDAMPKFEAPMQQDVFSNGHTPVAADNSSDSASPPDSHRSPDRSLTSTMSGSASVPVLHQKPEVLSPTRRRPCDSPPYSSMPVVTTNGPLRKSLGTFQPRQRALVRSSSRPPPIAMRSSGSHTAPIGQDLSASLRTVSPQFREVQQQDLTGTSSPMFSRSSRVRPDASIDSSWENVRPWAFPPTRRTDQHGSLTAPCNTNVLPASALLGSNTVRRLNSAIITQGGSTTVPVATTARARSPSITSPQPEALGSVSPLATRGRVVQRVEQGSTLSLTPQRSPAYVSSQRQRSPPKHFPSRVSPWSVVASEPLTSTFLYPAESALNCSRFQVGGSLSSLSLNSVPSPFLPRSANHIC